MCFFPLFVTLRSRKEKTRSPALCSVRTEQVHVQLHVCRAGLGSTHHVWRWPMCRAGTGAAPVLPLETPACTPSPAAHPGAVAPASLSSQVTPTSPGGATSSRGQFCCPSSSGTCTVVSWFAHLEPRDTPNWTVVASPVPGFTRMFCCKRVTRPAETAPGLGVWGWGCLQGLSRTEGVECPSSQLPCSGGPLGAGWGAQQSSNMVSSRALSETVSAE